MRLSCQSWRCQTCGMAKLTETAQQLADATTDLTNLYHVFVPTNIHNNVKRFLTKKKISSLNIKLNSGLVYVVTSDLAVGINWGTDKVGREEAIIGLFNQVEFECIKRRDFTLDWKPEPLYEPKRDTVVFSRSYTSIDHLYEDLAASGQNINNDFIEGDVLDVVDNMIKVDDSQLIMVDGREHNA